MEIENAIFQDLENFGKRIFEMTMENFWTFVRKNHKNILSFISF